MSNSHHLTVRQEKALAAVLSTATLSAAARQAHVGERSLRRWMRDDATFRAELRQRCRDSYGAGIFRLQLAAVRAVYTLSSILTDPKASASARTTAAVAIIKLAMQAVAIGDEMELLAVNRLD